MTDVCCEQDLEHYWLASTPFVAGGDISIADLIIIMELTQLKMLEGALQARPQHAARCANPFMREPEGS